MKKFTTKLKLVTAALFVTLGFNAMAATIYDDYAAYNGLSFSMTNGQSIGNEINVSAGIWTLTNFSIEYYAPSALASTIGIDVQFYTTNGPVTENGFNTPQNLIYNSGWYFGIGGGGLPGSGFQVVTYNTTDFSSGTPPLSVKLPGDFVFVVTYTNTAGPSLGLSGLQSPLATNTPGISYGDYWVENSGVWTLRTNATTAANLVVDFSGTVPEPSMMGLGAIGGALLYGASRLRRKS
jgi:hypothetical protein